jgi:hypothetical protein
LIAGSQLNGDGWRSVEHTPTERDPIFTLCSRGNHGLRGELFKTGIAVRIYGEFWSMTGRDVDTKKTARNDPDRHRPD